MTGAAPGASDGADGRVRVLYTDLDGTLLGPTGNLLWTSDRSPTLAAVTALLRAAEEGLEIVPLSGRSRRSMLELARLLGLTTWFCELGGVRVYDRGADVVIEGGRGPEGEPPVVALGPVLERLCAAFPGRLEAHAPWNEGREVTLLLRGARLAEAEAWLADHGPPGLRLVDNGVVPRSFPGLPGVEPVHAFHLAPAGVSKEEAIAADQARRGLGRHQCAIVGDSRSELACADVVGRCFLVRNALALDPAIGEDAVAVGAEVTDAGHTEGFAETVTRLLDI